MNDPQVREKLARISMRPATEWTKRIAQEFPGDAAMRMQALLWLHAEKQGPEVEGSPPSLGEACTSDFQCESEDCDVATSTCVSQSCSG